MSTIQRVARNTGVIITGDVIFRMISVFVTIYLARYLGMVEFGKYSFVFAYLTFFNILTDLGLQVILVREMSRDPSTASKLIGNAYIIRLILAAFAIVLSLTIITLMSYPADTTTYVYIAAFSLLFISFSDFYRTIFEANLRMEYNIIAKLAFKVLSTGLIFWIIFVLQGTLTHILLALVFSESIKMLISFLFSRKFVRPKFEIDFGCWKYLFKECLPLAMTGVIWVIYYQIDKVMLSIMMGNAAVGLYSAAYKLCDPLLLIPTALMMSLYPIMSIFSKTSKDRLIKSYILSVKYLLIVMLPIAIGVTLLSNRIIFLIYGTEFAYSTTPLQILIWSIMFGSINSVLLSLLISIDRQKLNTLSTGICAVTNVTLNFFLIPILSYNGAAIATVVTNAVLFISSFYFVSKHLQVLPMHKIAIKPVISGLLMGAFIYYFRDVNIFLLISLGTIIYSIVLLALKTFTEEDWGIVRKIIKRQ